MNTQELKNLAVESAKIYDEYLRQNAKGLERISVQKVEFVDNFVQLSIYSPIRFPEKIEIEISGVHYDKQDIRVIQFDQEENTILLLPRITLKSLFYKVEAKDIKVVVDLREQVMQVGRWFERLDGELCLPNQMPELDFELEYSNSLSEKQKQMEEGVFQHPFTFLWGERGAVKTFAVLADCIMNYVRNEKKVIITAPTNEALDRTLSYVLEILKREHFPLKRALRLGLPTQKFAKRYHDACEFSGIDRMVSGMESRIKTLEEAYEFFSYYQQYEKLKTHFAELFQKLEDVYQYKKEVFELLKETEESWKEKDFKRQRLNRDVKDLNKNILKKEDEIARYRSNRMKFLIRTKLEEAEANRDQLRQELETRNHRVEELDYELNLLTLRKDQLNRAYVSDQRDQMYLNDLRRLAEFDIDLSRLMQSINEKNYSERKEKLIKIMAAYDNVMKERGRKYHTYRDLPLEQMLSKINTLTAERSNLVKMSTVERAKEVLIVAAPIDTFLARIADHEEVLGTDARHIFMEEAGNCPVIKGLALLRKKIPITLVGDYSQQELICEMSHNEMLEKEHQPVVLWAQSVLHIEELVDGTFEDFFAAYMKEQEAPYEQLVVL